MIKTYRRTDEVCSVLLFSALKKTEIVNFLFHCN